MATSYHSSSAAAIFYPRQCSVCPGDFALKWLYCCFSFLHIVRIPTSRRKIQLPEINSWDQSCMRFIVCALFTVSAENTPYTDTWEGHTLHSLPFSSEARFHWREMSHGLNDCPVAKVKNQWDFPAPCLNWLYVPWPREVTTYRVSARNITDGQEDICSLISWEGGRLT